MFVDTIKWIGSSVAYRCMLDQYCRLFSIALWMYCATACTITTSLLLSSQQSWSSMDSCLKFLLLSSMILNNLFLSLLYNVHVNKKCDSSSISLKAHLVQRRSSSFTFVRLPISIFSSCALSLNLVISFLTVGFFTTSRYCSCSKSSLNFLNVRSLFPCSTFDLFLQKVVYISGFKLSLYRYNFIVSSGCVRLVGENGF